MNNYMLSNYIYAVYDKEDNLLYVSDRLNKCLIYSKIKTQSAITHYKQRHIIKDYYPNELLFENKYFKIFKIPIDID